MPQYVQHVKVYNYITRMICCKVGFPQGTVIEPVLVEHLENGNRELKLWHE